MVLSDDRRHIVDVNGATVRLLGYTREEMVGRPLWEFAYDTDPKQSAQTRARALERFATDQTLILSYHFPWPGLGRVTKEGEGYGWIQAPMDVTSLG